MPEPLTRARIVAAAIDLIEREGADAISMRRIAADLGAGVMSLYNHVPNKAALLDAVAESVYSRIEFTDDPSAEWTERVRAQARAFRQIAHHYPRSTMVVISRQLRSPAGILPVEHALVTLREAGFGGEDAVRLLRTFIAYIIGSLLREVGVTPTFAPAQGQDKTPVADPALFPEVGRLAPLLGSCDHEDSFEFGLDMLIRAAADRLQEVRAAARDAETGDGSAGEDARGGGENAGAAFKGSARG
ncbi:TetR family transcriptional regulator [Sphaerisporangium siamense]|uniref:AcrR family transcriptional regulator n=1 Tax=Sphaerisporangium siamense TaxID=795645 RepID=A0A7W7GDF4_9ACTN|nr:TetR/AcrR family transcriptional regulator C-terminal domain-containing protein [Sphaerisporangium siamense]MBB4702971.1 AcrR family transcriptional regulator [Sphaerisporangium siamense]GII83270.1 TetR family transcriptional regulator [Sphaerisporangium siamense]